MNMHQWYKLFWLGKRFRGSALHRLRLDTYKVWEPEKGDTEQREEGNCICRCYLLNKQLYFMQAYVIIISAYMKMKVAE